MNGEWQAPSLLPLRRCRQASAAHDLVRRAHRISRRPGVPAAGSPPRAAWRGQAFHQKWAWAHVQKAVSQRSRCRTSRTPTARARHPRGCEALSPERRRQHRHQHAPAALLAPSTNEPAAAASSAAAARPKKVPEWARANLHRSARERTGRFCDLRLLAQCAWRRLLHSVLMVGLYRPLPTSARSSHHEPRLLKGPPPPPATGPSYRPSRGFFQGLRRARAQNTHMLTALHACELVEWAMSNSADSLVVSRLLLRLPLLPCFSLFASGCSPSRPPSHTRAPTTISSAGPPPPPWPHPSPAARRSLACVKTSSGALAFSAISVGCVHGALRCKKRLGSQVTNRRDTQLCTAERGVPLRSAPCSASRSGSPAPTLLSRQGCAPQRCGRGAGMGV